MQPFKTDRKQKSFFDTQIYDRLIPQDHLLVKLNKTIDFSFIEDECSKYYSHLGQKGENPVVLFKMLLLAYLFDLSERSIEEHCNYNMLFKMFLGLDADQLVPDHSTISKFRKRIGVEGFTAIFNRIVEIAKHKGIIANKLRIVDSTHMLANVDFFKAVQNSKDMEDDDHDPTSLPGGPDPDARKGAKSRKKKFFGYKHHIGIDSKHDFITNSGTSGGNIHDNDFLLEMASGDAPESLTADKLYDSRYNHEQLGKRGIKSLIIRKKNSDPPDDPDYPVAVKLRKRVERVFAVIKKYHSGGRARYWGRPMTTIQNLIIAALYDLKIMAVLMNPPGEMCPES
jgi:IS5 family transposase